MAPQGWHPWQGNIIIMRVLSVPLICSMALSKFDLVETEVRMGGGGSIFILLFILFLACPSTETLKYFFIAMACSSSYLELLAKTWILFYYLPGTVIWFLEPLVVVLIDHLCSWNLLDVVEWSSWFLKSLVVVLAGHSGSWYLWLLS